MKKLTILPLALCLLMLGIAESCKSKFDEKKYLTEVLNNIEQVKTASYFYTMLMSDHGDTVPSSSPNRQFPELYVNEFANPADTAVGASIIEFLATDTTKMFRYYHEYTSIPSINHVNKTIRMSYSAGAGVKIFFNSAKNIIKYALTSNDSLLTEFHDFGDSLLFRLTAYSDKPVMLDSKLPDPGSITRSSTVSSKYDIWINKTSGLPYKRETLFSVMPMIYWEEVSDVQINKMDIKDFTPTRYIPSDYEIEVSGQRETIPLIDLTGQIAPDWILSDYNNETFSLNDFKSKVLLINFSGILCGPCALAQPYLKQLVIDYKDKSFELIRIECWSNNFEAIKSYRLNNDIEYKFLISDKVIEKKYNVLSVPTFFILDGNRTIQYVKRGYGLGTTDKEIRDVIEKLL